MIPLGIDLLLNHKSNHSIIHGYAPILLASISMSFAYFQHNKWLILVAVIIILWAWYQNRKYYRQIIDIPTAKISSAPQGLVELSGTGHYLDGKKTFCPLSKLSCLWYSFRVIDTSNQQRRVINSGISTTNFLIDDGSGLVIVDPENAYVISRHQQSWQENDCQCTESMLFENDALYVLGELSNRNIQSNALNTNAQTAEILNEWKQDQTSLKQRFDKNKDGVIDSDEWESARQLAHTEALLGRSPKQAPLLQFIQKPRHGGLFILSNYPAHELAKKFRRWSWLLLTVLFIMLALGSKIIY